MSRWKAETWTGSKAAGSENQRIDYLVEFARKKRNVILKVIMKTLNSGVLGYLTMGWLGFGLALGQSTAPGSLKPAEVVPFFGRWDMTLESGEGKLASWLEVLPADGQPKAQMVGRWGNARLLPKLEIVNDRILFVSPRQEEGAKEDLVFKGQIRGQKLEGEVNGPDGTTWQWSAVRAPSLERTAKPHWGAPVRLFDGQGLSGWHRRTPKAEFGWRVKNGVLVNTPPSCDLVSDRAFDDFKLHIEFNCPVGANSGVYLRGRYEVQIEDDSTAEPPSHHMGGVYGFLAPNPEQPRRPGQWQSFDITLIGRHVTVAQNGVTIIDNQEIPGLTGGALDSDEAAPGPIFLQGDHGELSFRNITVTPAAK
jgi:hypothetical protein